MVLPLRVTSYSNITIYCHAFGYDMLCRMMCSNIEYNSVEFFLSILGTLRKHCAENCRLLLRMIA